MADEIILTLENAFAGNQHTEDGWNYTEDVNVKWDEGNLVIDVLYAGLPGRRIFISETQLDLIMRLKEM